MSASREQDNATSSQQFWYPILNKLIPFMVLICMLALVVSGARFLKPTTDKGSNVPTIVLSPEASPGAAKTLPADQLFEFASSVIGQTGLKTLAELATSLEQEAPAKVIIVGHTDALGSTSFNSKLSQARADAVREQLLKSKKIRPQSVFAIGVADHYPIIKAAQCPGKAEAELIQCLAPNRRVEIWTKPDAIAQ
ncbi:OmpA family protein [Pseudoduganella violacea]|uniref:OOP family OmpA-OmpF porin n=1 Tax=Pseudoduganella violacea TaxID=1715466 RepID=A0A7W5BEH2_9BURK|nr:OmpA family protein [Pseudoduganella violacea]MBB3121634.1 OOP family OmpA-OmpF porin [Pseudoduganella violacea]